MLQSKPEPFLFGMELVGDNDTPGKPIYLQPSWFTRGAVIVGVPGVGKSHDIALIARNLGDSGVAVVLVDRTGEHAETLSQLPFCRVYNPDSNLHLSLLEPEPGWKPDETIEAGIETLANYVQVSFPDSLGLSSSGQKIIGKCLAELYKRTKGRVPTMSELLTEVQEYKEERFYQGLVESREAVVSRLRPLTVGTAKNVFDSGENLPFETFFSPGIHLVNLAPFKVEHPKDLVTQVIIKKLCLMAKGKDKVDHLRQLLIIDEAHHVAPDKGSYRSYLDTIVTENRKYGQGVIVATTSPSQLSKWLMKNISVKICHLLNDGDDINLMLRFMANQYEADRFVSDFMLLRTGEAMIRVSTPVQVPKTKVKVSG